MVTGTHGQAVHNHAEEEPVNELDIPVCKIKRTGKLKIAISFVTTADRMLEKDIVDATVGDLELVVKVGYATLCYYSVISCNRTRN